MEKPTINIIELFSGIGAPTQALLKKYNVNHILAVDFDNHAMKSYNKLYGTKFKSTNILHTQPYWSTAPIDLLHMSPPCTKFSVQGKGGGDRDNETEKMWEKCVEYVKVWKPDYISYENVKQTKDTIIFTQLDLNLTELGYEMIFDNVLNAKDFGLPQNRERYFVMWVKAELLPKNKYGISGKYRMLRNFVNQNNMTPTPPLISIWDLNAIWNVAQYQPVINDENKLIFNYESNSQNGKAVIIDVEKLHDTGPKNKKHIVATIQQEYDINLPIEKYNNLKFNSDAHFLGINGISGTITAQGSAPFKNKILRKLYNGSGTIMYRNLTTIELGRLQGFSDEMIKTILSVNSENQTNKQIGNSIAVNCLEAIYDAIDFKGGK